MYIYGELPEDVEEQDTTLGPPPAWFQMQGPAIDPSIYTGDAYSPQFYGLGDREEEIEVNPIEELQNLKFKQEMNKKIPSQANRYTEVDPLSPMFREKKAKFGFGAVEMVKKPFVKLAIIALIVWFLFRKNK